MQAPPQSHLNKRKRLDLKKKDLRNLVCVASSASFPPPAFVFLTKLYQETNLTAKELFTRIPPLDLMYNFYRWYLQNKQNVINVSFLYIFVE